MVDLERRLRDYGAEIDSTLPRVTPADIYSRAQERVAEVETPHQRRWTPLRVVVVAAALALLLFLPIFLGNLNQPPVDPEPVTSTLVTDTTAAPTTTAPTDVDSFVSETSLGIIEWTRVDSEPPITPVGVLDGMILGEENDSEFNTIGFWDTSDGINWEPTGEPEISPRAYVPVGEDTLAAVSSGGIGVMMGPESFRQVLARFWQGAGDPAIYLREQGSEWVEVPLPDAAPEPVEGLEVFGPGVLQSGGLDASNWIVPLTYFVRVPWADTYGTFPNPEIEPFPPDPAPIWNEDAGLLEIYRAGRYPGGREASLTVELVDGQPATIEFRDAETGDLVHTVEATLPGWSPEELLTAVRGWGLDDPYLVVSVDGEVSVARPPWPMGEEWDGNIVVANGRYYTTTLTLGEDYAATAIHLWESADGLTWERTDLTQVHDGPLNTVSLVGGSDQLLLTVSQLDGTTSIWISTDGHVWEETQAEHDGFVEATDFGWMATGLVDLWMSGDGITWEQVSLPESTEDSVSYYAGVFFSGSGRWVGRFVD